ncbi:unnamed protein product [Boreogadus saida]
MLGPHAELMRLCIDAVLVLCLVVYDTADRRPSCIRDTGVCRGGLSRTGQSATTDTDPPQPVVVLVIEWQISTLVAGAVVSVWKVLKQSPRAPCHCILPPMGPEDVTGIGARAQDPGNITRSKESKTERTSLQGDEGSSAPHASYIDLYSYTDPSLTFCLHHQPLSASTPTRTLDSPPPTSASTSALLNSLASHDRLTHPPFPPPASDPIAHPPHLMP